MTSDPGPNAQAVPWYLRLKTLILSAGALAAAIVAVITLLNLIGPKEDVNDSARIDSVLRVRPMTLSEFETERLGGELPLLPGPTAEGREQVTGGTPGRNAVVRSLPSPSGETPKPTPSSSPPAAGTPDPTATATPTPTPPPGGSEAVARMIRSDPRLGDHDIRPSDMKVVPAIGGDYGDPRVSDDPSVVETDPLPPEEVVDELLAAFAEVEGGDPNTLNPQGYLYVVDLAIKGHKEERLMLTYSLDAIEGGAQTPESWRAENLAYFMTPSTDDDTGIAELWIPDLVAPGPYAVNVELTLVAENLKVAFKQSEAIDE